MLKNAGKLVIETLHEGRNAARNLEELARGNCGQLLIIFPLLGALGDDDLLVRLKDLEKAGDLLLSSLPVFL